MKITFTNPGNAYSENYDTAVSPIWCFLFGPFYWLARANIAHALLSFGLALVTCGVSWFIYPLFANKINIRNYRRRGWIVTNETAPAIKGLRRVAIEPRAHKTKYHAWYWKNWAWTVPLTIVLISLNFVIWPSLIHDLTR